jgi:histidyl-tRNA synthetase
MIQKMRGTMDILPDKIPAFRYIEEKSREICRLYRFDEIRTPTFEATELFHRGVGDTTDIVQKEMYTFSDLDGRSLTLRPEGTASVARAVVENGLYGAALPLKLFYLINCFRYEAPQAGRSREFFQFGGEIFGSASSAADVTAISLADAVISGIGISDYRLAVNSIGCPKCRPDYRAALVEYFTARSEKLCNTCKERLKTNPLRILDCKCESCKEVAKDAPITINYLCDECKEHFESLKQGLTESGISYTVDTSIVRGLDYYTKTVFEFITDNIGAQSTICGGGRYDGLVESVGGNPLPAVGFAMGITRLILAMEAEGVKLPENESPLIYIVPLGNAAQTKALSLTRELRKKGIIAECDITGRSLKSQMKYADKISAKYVLIMGENELVEGKAPLREMASGEQNSVAINVDEIVSTVHSAKCIVQS